MAESAEDLVLVQCGPRGRVALNHVMIYPGETRWERRDVVKALLAERPWALIVLQDPTGELTAPRPHKPGKPRPHKAAEEIS